MKKIKLLTGEIFKDLKLKRSGKRKMYAVSNKGRIASYKDGLMVDGRILTGSVLCGYVTLNIRGMDIQSPIYIHREVAKLFLPKPTSKQKYVIHLNHKRNDNHENNLCWVDVDRMIEHQQESPAKKKYKEVQANQNIGRKLNVKDVKAIKEILSNENRKVTIKQIAANYNVSQMTIYRIKVGDNWRNVKV